MTEDCGPMSRARDSGGGLGVPRAAGTNGKPASDRRLHHVCLVVSLIWLAWYADNFILSLSTSYNSPSLDNILVDVVVPAIFAPLTPESLATMRGSTFCKPGSKNPCPAFDATAYDAFRAQEIAAGIQRIYYINLKKNVLRRARIESLLSEPHTQLAWKKEAIPYTRINAIRGDEDPAVCAPTLQDPHRCAGVVGIVKSNLHIMQYHNVTGLTLVMEDDFLPRNLSLIEEAVRWIPPDWDIIRFECVDYDVRSTFDRIKHPDPDFVIFRANHMRPCNSTRENCDYCGGAFAMLWRESSLSKLYHVWTDSPSHDLNCRLAMDNTVRSYCFNTRGQAGLHAPPQGEFSDIPKNGVPKNATRKLHTMRPPRR